LKATKGSSARPAARTDASAAFANRQVRRWTAVVEPQKSRSQDGGGPRPPLSSLYSNDQIDW
jgi:hypothetical protein